MSTHLDTDSVGGGALLRSELRFCPVGCVSGGGGACYLRRGSRVINVTSSLLSSTWRPVTTCLHPPFPPQCSCADHRSPAPEEKALLTFTGSKPNSCFSLMKLKLLQLRPAEEVEVRRVSTCVWSGGGSACSSLLSSTRQPPGVTGVITSQAKRTVTAKLD